jgi:hypothetical protein
MDKFDIRFEQIKFVQRTLENGVPAMTWDAIRYYKEKKQDDLKIFEIHYGEGQFMIHFKPKHALVLTAADLEDTLGFIRGEEAKTVKGNRE